MYKKVEFKAPARQMKTRDVSNRLSIISLLFTIGVTSPLLDPSRNTLQLQSSKLPDWDESAMGFK